MSHPIFKEFFYGLKNKDIAQDKEDVDLIKSEISKHLFDFMAIMLYFVFAELEAEQKRENKKISGDSSNFYVGLLSKKQRNNYFYQLYFVKDPVPLYWVFPYNTIPHPRWTINSRIWSKETAKWEKACLKQSRFVRYKLHSVIDRIIEDATEYDLDSYQNCFMAKFDDRGSCLKNPVPNKKRAFISLSVNNDKSVSAFPGKVLVEDDPASNPVYDRRSKLLLPSTVLEKGVDYRLNMQ